MSENNLYNKLPDEIILKILYRIDNIKDLINIYKASKKLKNMVTSEIVRHFNKNDCSNIYKYFNESKDFDDFEDFKESSNKYVLWPTESSRQEWMMEVSSLARTSMSGAVVLVGDTYVVKHSRNGWIRSRKRPT